MKTIDKLDDTPEPIEALPQGVKLPTYRQLFKAAIGNALGKSSEEAIELFHVGVKVKDAKDELVLEDAEFKLLKEKCEANPAQWTAHFHAQVVLKLKKSEETKT